LTGLLFFCEAPVGRCNLELKSHSFRPPAIALRKRVLSEEEITALAHYLAHL
jgi:hypothetical protein